MDLGGKVYIGGLGCRLGWVPGGLGWAGWAGKVWESLGAGNASWEENI